MTIPKYIHQSWKTTDIPDEVYPHFWQESWKTLHPDWEYRLWTDEDNRELVRSHYPQFLSFYDSLDWGIKRADFSRFLYMHRYGGLYVDLDFVALRDQTPLLEGASLVVGRLSDTNPFYQIANAYLASEPGHEFWMQIAEDVLKTPAREWRVEAITGPLKLQWALEKFFPSGLRVLDQHLIHPIDWVYSKDWDEGKFYRADMAQLAKDIRHLSIAEIQQKLPDSFAVTAWCGNWQ